MSGEENLDTLIKHMTPELQEGSYVFSTLKQPKDLDLDEIVMIFKEEEGSTVIIKKDKADELGLDYDFVAAWITLKVHSSLEAVGLTSAFSKSLAEADISCNVVAGYYHDHIFVGQHQAEKALDVLKSLSSRP